MLTIQYRYANVGCILQLGYRKLLSKIALKSFEIYHKIHDFFFWHQYTCYLQNFAYIKVHSKKINSLRYYRLYIVISTTIGSITKLLIERLWLHFFSQYSYCKILWWYLFFLIHFLSLLLILLKSLLFCFSSVNLEIEGYPHGSALYNLGIAVLSKFLKMSSLYNP